MDEGGIAGVGSLGAFAFPLGRNGGANLGEGGYDVRSCVVEGGAGVADGDAYELNASPVSA